MGHRGGTRYGFVLLAFGVACLLSLATAGPARAGDQPVDTLLPPVSGSDVSIVPTDQRPADPAKPPTHSPSVDGSSRTPLLDLDDVDPLTAATWGVLALLALAATGGFVSRLVRMLYVWRSPASLGASGFGPLSERPMTSFSLLVPTRPSSSRLGLTLDRLASLDHPAFEILVVVPYDDLAARGAALAAAARHLDRVRVVVDHGYRTTRAVGLNTALDECGGEVVGVIEPGDEVHPRLLRHVDACLSGSSLGAVQGGVQLYAPVPRWFSSRSIVERYFWSRSRLHFHAQQYFTPLEGSTVFVRTDVLRDAGGWDEGCVAEGCELGVRLSVRGTPIMVAYDPELATGKLAPERLGELLRQQIHWIRGFVQTLRKGVWRRLPTRRQRLRARTMLARPFVEAFTGAAVTIALAGAILSGAPPLIVLLALAPVIPALMTVGVEMAALAELNRVEGRHARARDRLYLVVSAVPHQLLLAVAAVHVLVSEIFSRREPKMPVAPNGTGPLEGRRLDADPDGDDHAGRIVDVRQPAIAATGEPRADALDR